MSKSSTPTTCIYCSGAGPFTIEHVIPAGLGGDDKRFLLKKMVCGDCNTKVFSPLEADFLRNSTVALGRIFMQPSGRKRNGESNAPKFGGSSKHLLDADGRFKEFDFGMYGRPIILPQIVQSDDQTYNSSSIDIDSFRIFVQDAQTIMDDSLTCVRKMSDDEGSNMLATNYIWSNKQYVTAGAAEVVTKLPKKYLWQAEMDVVSDKNGPSYARLFKRRNGQLVIKIGADRDIEKVLTFFRKCFEQIDLGSIKEKNIENPLVSVTASFRIDIVPRMIAKIGLNLLAYLTGPDYVRISQFDQIKQTIVTGTPELPIVPEQMRADMLPVFAMVPEGHHMFVIAEVPMPNGHLQIGVVAHLYGSQVENVILGVNLPSSKLSLPVIFTVDYRAHVIEQYSFNAFFENYVRRLQETNE